MTPKTIPWCLGLDFFMGLLPILSIMDGPAKSVGCPAAEKNLHLLTLYYKCNGFVLLMEEEKGWVPATIP